MGINILSNVFILLFGYMTKYTCIEFDLSCLYVPI